jgi:hypothetical protein
MSQQAEQHRLQQVFQQQMPAVQQQRWQRLRRLSQQERERQQQKQQRSHQHQLHTPSGSGWESSRDRDRVGCSPAASDAGLKELQQLLLRQGPIVRQLATAAQSEVGRLTPAHLACLAHSFAVLGLLSHWPPAESSEVVRALWGRALDQDPSHHLDAFALPEVGMLLQSAAALEKQQSRWGGPGQFGHYSQTPLVEDIAAAAAQRMVAAVDSELDPHTAAALLQAVAKLCCCGTAAGDFSSSSGSSSRHGSLAAITAEAAVKLLHCLSSPGALSVLRDSELVMLAAAAPQLAAAAAAARPSPSAPSSSSSSSAFKGALQDLLGQMSLPLAAVSGSLSLRDLSNVVSGYAAAAVAAPELFDSVSSALQRREILEFGGSWAMARVLSAYATAGHTDESLFAAVADTLMPRLPQLPPRVLARFAWAMAAVGLHDPEVFSAIGTQLLLPRPARRLHQQQHVVLQGSAAASSSGRHHHSSGSSSSSRQSGVETISTSSPASTAQAAKLVEQLQARDVAAVTWAFATAGCQNLKLYLMLADAAVERLQDFTAQQLSSLLWGFGSVGFCHERLVAAVLQRVMSNDSGQQQQQQQQRRRRLHVAGQPQLSPLLQGASAQDVATLAWSLAELKAASAAAMTACVMHFLGNTRQYSAADAADLAWALVWSGWAVQEILQGGGEAADRGEAAVEAVAVLQQLLAVAVSDVQQLCPEQLANMMLVAALAAESAVGGDSSSSSSSSSAGQHQPSLHSTPAHLLDAAAAWGPDALTPADGLKVLWAMLLVSDPTRLSTSAAAAGQQQPTEGKKKQQQQQHAGPGHQHSSSRSAAAAVIQAKLLSAGGL